jgi:hypothetical protein
LDRGMGSRPRRDVAPPTSGESGEAGGCSTRAPSRYWAAPWPPFDSHRTTDRPSGLVRRHGYASSVRAAPLEIDPPRRLADERVVGLQVDPPVQGGQRRQPRGGLRRTEEGLAQKDGVSLRECRIANTGREGVASKSAAYGCKERRRGGGGVTSPQKNRREERNQGRHVVRRRVVRQPSRFRGQASSPRHPQAGPWVSCLPPSSAPRRPGSAEP